MLGFGIYYYSYVMGWWWDLLYSFGPWRRVSSSELPCSLGGKKAVICNMCILVWECCTRGQDCCSVAVEVCSFPHACGVLMSRTYHIVLHAPTQGFHFRVLLAVLDCGIVETSGFRHTSAEAT